jgi:hypothetical protein
VGLCALKPAQEACRHAVGYEVGLSHTAGHLQGFSDGECLQRKQVEQQQQLLLLLLLLMLLRLCR